MTLTCEPPANIDLGEISGSEWKFKGRDLKDNERIKITTSGPASKLTVSNIIPADKGK